MPLLQCLKKTWYTILCILLCQAPVTAADENSFFKNTELAATMKKSLQQLYNYEFDNAEKTISPLRAKYQNTPPLLIFDCLYLYWHNYPVSAHPKEYDQYKKGLVKALNKAETLLDGDDDNPEYIFYCLLLDIMLARQNSEDENTMKAVNYTRKAYGYIKRGFRLQGQCSEFYFTTGLYKYYREFYPGQHPVYKPFLFIFPSGNKTEGLNCLDKAATATLFVMPEAMMFASYINLRYENNPARGLYYASMLNKYYPNNLFFKVLYIENLLQAGHYAEAVPQLETLRSADLSYGKLAVALFQGMLEEKYYKRPAEAEKWYRYAINLQKKPIKATENYYGLACYGLANVYSTQGRKEEARGYYKKAADNCHYVSVRKTAENL